MSRKKTATQNLQPPIETFLGQTAHMSMRLIQGDRASSYGDAKTSFERIASLWSTYKGVEITAKDVASMMILLKVSRGVTSAKRDNWLDIIGYAALGSEIAQTQQPHRA